MGARYRVGIDVGGTFTKAVVVDNEGSVVAAASTPTTYKGELGIARGILAALSRALEDGGVNPGMVERVTFTTTHNVNALLEGDLARVGLIVLARREHSNKAREAVAGIGPLDVAPGRRLEVIRKLIVHDGLLDGDDAERAVMEVLSQGAEAIAVSEAFGVDDPSREALVAEKAREAGVPSVAGHELSMVYGLEVRTYTAVLNAGILPYMSKVAAAVEEGMRRLGVEADVYVVRGDGGSSSLEVLRSRPLLTVMSGPAASAIGAAYWAGVWSGVVVEVGGTTTNVVPVKWGLAPTTYLKVLGRPTTVRVVDAEIVPVGGGSLPRLGRGGLIGVGPRSAHIAGMAYASFTDPEVLDGAKPEIVSPLPGDPKAYLALRVNGGVLVAVTPTCAAAALGVEVPGASRDSARAALEALEPVLGLSWRDAAKRILLHASRAVAEAVSSAAGRHGIDVRRHGVAGGGGAWFLAMEAARLLRAPFRLLEHAPFLSAAGAAVSLAGESVEVGVAGGRFASRLRRALDSLESQTPGDGFVVYTESDPPRRVLRAVAVEAPRRKGPLKPPRKAAAEALGTDPSRLKLVYDGGGLMVFAAERRRGLPLLRQGRFEAAVADRWGRVYLAASRADIYVGGPREVVEAASRLKPRFMVAPAVHLVDGSRLIDFSLVYRREELVESIESYVADSRGSLCLVVRW